MVLGPLLTLLIYNYHKKTREVVFDLSVIALIQAAALVWGSMAIYSKKPAAVVFWEDRFYTVSMDYYQAMNVTQKQLNTYSEERPPIIFAKKPADIDAFKEMMYLSSEDKIPAFAQAQLYESIKPNITTILKYSYEYNSILANNPGRFQETKLAVDQTENNVFGTYLMSKHKNMFLLVTAEGDLAGYLSEKTNSEDL